jgi:hypothetical protein
MALLHSPFDGEKSKEFLAGDDFPMPGDQDSQHYDRYLLTAAQTRWQQLHSKSNGAPGILITAMPKSASEFLCSVLAECLEAAVCRVTIGNPLFGTTNAKWVAAVAEGGCVTHDHFAATQSNLATLQNGGIDQVWVLVRDPRAVCWSTEKMRAEYDQRDGQVPIDCKQVCGSMSVLVEWIASWIRAQEAGFPVRFVRFQELTSNPNAVMGAMLEASDASRFLPRLVEVLKRRQDQGRVSSNFRQGDDNAWRTQIPTEIHSRLWEMIPEQVRSLLDLRE